MPDNYKLLVDTTGNFLIKTDVIPIGKTLGGVYSSYKLQWYMNPGAGKDKLDRSFLEIGLITNRPEMSKWRVWFDGISLTRELHPNYAIKLPQGYYYTVIFDITPIVRRDLSKAKHKVTVLNDGSEPLTLTHSIIINQYPDEKTLTTLKYLTGGILLPPQNKEKIEIDFKHTHKKTYMRLVSYCESNPSLLKINIADTEKYLEQTGHSDEIEFLLPKQDNIKIELSNMNQHIQKGRNWILIPLILVIGESTPSPNIIITEDSLVKQETNHRFTIKIHNEGDIVAKKVMIVAFASGIPVKTLELGDLEPGKEIGVQEEVSIPPEARILLYRIIWRENDEARYIEKRVRIK